MHIAHALNESRATWQSLHIHYTSPRACSGTEDEGAGFSKVSFEQQSVIVSFVHSDRQALGVSHRRSVSPQSACFDRHTADDTEVFDPELVSIVLRSKKNIGSPLPRTGGDNHPQEVIINVQWRYHPSEGQKPPRWTFHVNRVCFTKHN